jgi:putative oxidoreductase
VIRNPVYSLFHTPGTIAAVFPRLMLAVLFFYHGASKAFGWFGGEGFSATLETMTGSGGFGISTFLATVAVATEVAVAPLFLLGLFTRLAALATIFLMGGALYFVHGGGPFTDLQLPLLVLACGLCLLFLGGGTLSIDRRISRTLLPEVGSSLSY